MQQIYLQDTEYRAFLIRICLSRLKNHKIRIVIEGIGVLFMITHRKQADKIDKTQGYETVD